MEKHEKTVAAGAVRFAGLDASTPHGDGGIACDMKNFRILADGSLERRCGFGLLAALGEEIRAARVIREGGEAVILAVAGASLYRISVADGSLTSAVVLETTEGRVVFFEHCGVLYLMDGAEVYRYAGGVSLSPCVGYIPLYGLDWKEINGGSPINEPINLFSPKIRVCYKIEDSTTLFRLNLGMKIRSVDCVTLDGVRVEDYSVSELPGGENYAVVFPHSRYIDVAEVCVTLEDSYWHDALIRSCGFSAVYDGFSDSRVFLYGGDSGGLYVSLPVSEEAMSASLRCDASSTPLYFPKGHEACFGNGRDVTAVGRVGERMMICTEGSAWVTDEMSAITATVADKIVVRPLSQTVGCSSFGGFSMMNGEMPVTVSESGIYRWDIDFEMKRECTVTRISDGIAPLVEDGFFVGARACSVGAENELWFYLPRGVGGRVFIYNCTQGLWYSYDGIQAGLILDTSAGVVFSDGATFYRFDRGRDSDGLLYGEREIVGYYESRRMDFGNAEETRRAVRLFVEADVAGGELSVGLYDGSLLDEVTLIGGGGAFGFSSPVSTSRFHRLSVVLVARGSRRQRIYGFCVHMGR